MSHFGNLLISAGFENAPFSKITEKEKEKNIIIENILLNEKLTKFVLEKLELLEKYYKAELSDENFITASIEEN